MIADAPLRGLRAIVTGASRGYGEQIARRFVQAGASVLVTARSADRLDRLVADVAPARAEGQDVFAVPADAGREADIDRVVAAALERWGRIDVLVNCAGVVGPRGPLDETDWAEWKAAVELNLLGPVYFCRSVIPIMKRQGRGKIINISGGGATKAIQNLSSYGATKAGLVRLTETLALELAPHHIDVNAVAPGLLATQLAEQVMEVGAAILGNKYFEDVARQKRGEVDAFAKATGLCVFLASSESDGITGRLISAPWDPWPTLARRRAELAGSDIYTLRRITPEDRGKQWG